MDIIVVLSVRSFILLRVHRFTIFRFIKRDLLLMHWLGRWRDPYSLLLLLCFAALEGRAGPYFFDWSGVVLVVTWGRAVGFWVILFFDWLVLIGEAFGGFDYSALFDEDFLDGAEGGFFVVVLRARLVLVVGYGADEAWLCLRSILVKWTTVHHLASRWVQYLRTLDRRIPIYFFYFHIIIPIRIYFDF